MKPKIKVGYYYKIVGTKGGCGSGEKCKHCSDFTHGIKVTGFENSENRGKVVLGQSLSGIKKGVKYISHCSFCPDDLEQMAWKEIYK